MRNFCIDEGAYPNSLKIVTHDEKTKGKSKNEIKNMSNIDASLINLRIGSKSFTRLPHIPEPDRNITVELTRRREFNQASPDESSCETRSRRSRPTICWVALSGTMPPD